MTPSMFQQLPQIRFEGVGVTHHSQVRWMRAVYRRFTVGADQVVTGTEVKVLHAGGFELVVGGFELCGSLLVVLDQVRHEGRAGPDALVEEEDGRLFVVLAEEIDDSDGALGRGDGAGSSSARNCATSTSIRPLPEKPKLRTGESSRRPRMAGKAMPGREAQPPCVIEVP